MATHLWSFCVKDRPPVLVSAGKEPCQRTGLGCTRSLEGTQLAQLTQTDQRDVLCHVVSCWTIKLGEVGQGASIAWGRAGHWLAAGEQLLCSSLALGFVIFVPLSPPFLFFPFLLNCPYLIPQVLVLFFSILSPIPLWACMRGVVSQQLCGV